MDWCSTAARRLARRTCARCAIDDWVERVDDLPKVLLPYKAGMVDALISFRLEE